MTHVYALDCTPFADGDIPPETLARLDTLRQQQVQRLQVPQKRAQCVAAGLLLTHLWGQDGLPPVLSHGSRGKPYLAAKNDCFFNLSHTGNWVFCAVSGHEVGLDAQTVEPAREAVTARCFTPPEQDWLAAQENRDEAFTRLWTLKEAYLKYTGFGLVLPMSGLTVPIPADGNDSANHCRWQEYIFGGIRAAVCADPTETIDPKIAVLTAKDILEG